MKIHKGLASCRLCQKSLLILLLLLILTQYFFIGREGEKNINVRETHGLVPSHTHSHAPARARDQACNQPRYENLGTNQTQDPSV